eukprot:4525609-Prymnesium_polylepis.2
MLSMTVQSSCVEYTPTPAARYATTIKTSMHRFGSSSLNVRPDSLLDPVSGSRSKSSRSSK